MDSTSIAEQALQLLFKKLHPHLEDAAHALESGAPATELLRLHRRLGQARHQAVEVLEAWADEGGDEALSEILDTLAANLTPVGETYLQSLVLTQLCLEEAPGDLLPFVEAGRVAGSPWGLFTVGLTIPIALFMGLYLRYLRPGRVGEMSALGVVLLLLAVWGGQFVSASGWSAAQLCSSSVNALIASWAPMPGR